MVRVAFPVFGLEAYLKFTLEVAKVNYTMDLNSLSHLVMVGQ